MARAMRAKAVWSSIVPVSRSRSGPALASISSRKASTSASRGRRRRRRRSAARAPSAPRMSAIGAAAGSTEVVQALALDRAVPRPAARLSRTPLSALAPIASMRACSTRVVNLRGPRSTAAASAAWAASSWWATRRASWSARPRMRVVSGPGEVARRMRQHGAVAGQAAARRRRTRPPGPAARRANARRGRARA